MFLPKDNTTEVVPIPYRYVLAGDPGNPDDNGIYLHRDDTLFAMNKNRRSKTMCMIAGNMKSMACRKKK